jgi:hypothetical protein
MNRFFKTLWLFLIIVSALATVTSAQAALKATAVVSAWDRRSHSYENGNVNIYRDGSWVPFIHELGFDNNLPPTPVCGTLNTKYAGALDFGLYHIDNAPAGALGFMETRRWQLVDCDLNGDGRINNTDLTIPPTPPPDPDVNSRAYGGYFEPLSPSPKDQLVPCDSGNCESEIVTTLSVNLDKDCNGSIDPAYPANVCFFAEAKVPGSSDLSPYWGGNLQARISAGGGEKTVNFNMLDPTAITLVKLAASSGLKEFRNTAISASVFAALLVSLVGTSLYRRKKQI